MGRSWISHICFHKDFLTTHLCLWHFLSISDCSCIYKQTLCLLFATCFILSWCSSIHFLTVVNFGGWSSFRTPLARVTGSCSDSTLHGDEPGQTRQQQVWRLRPTQDLNVCQHWVFVFTHLCSSIFSLSHLCGWRYHTTQTMMSWPF